MSCKCPGSTEENPHNLIVIDENTGNQICTNNKCYFMIQYLNGSGCWQIGFDPITAKSFVKQEKEIEIKND